MGPRTAGAVYVHPLVIPSWNAELLGSRRHPRRHSHSWVSSRRDGPDDEVITMLASRPEQVGQERCLRVLPESWCAWPLMLT